MKIPGIDIRMANETPSIQETTTGIQNVLIVDDEPLMCHMLHEIVNDLGYSASTMENPEHIEEELSKREVHLMLLDIQMPAMSGLDLLKIVRTISPMTLVIMVTGVTEMKTIIEAMKSGAVDYITKPVDPDALAVSMQRANEIYRLKKENQEYRDGLEKLVQKRTEQLYRFADALSKKNQMIVRANKELQEANEKLQSFLNQAIVSDKISTLGLLSSMLIHGIANPISVIAGINEVIKKRHTDDVTQKELEMMKNYIDQTLDLVNQVRSFARTEINQFLNVDLTEVIKNAVSLIGLINKKKKIQIRSKLEGSSLKVRGNQSQLEQVLVNLLQNAVDAITDEGTIDISVESSLDKSANVVIRDSGSGLNPEHEKKIFSMFFTSKPPGKGTGLGLFICKEIMEKHGGTIQLASEPGKGATVTLGFKLSK